MIAEKAKQFFDQFSTVKVLFLFDPERNFETEVKSISGEGFEVLIDNGQYFALKRKLLFDYQNAKVLLYLPFDRPKAADKFPLYDLLLANKELVLGDEGELIQRYNLDSSKRSLLAKYSKELMYNSIREVVDPILSKRDFNTRDFLHGMFSAFFGFKEPVHPSLIMAKLLSLHSDRKELERIENKLNTYELWEDFNRYVHYGFDQSIEDFSEESIEQLIKKLKYNLISQYFGKLKEDDPYRYLSIADKRCQAFLNQLMQEARKYPATDKKLKQALAEGGKSVRELRIVEMYGAKVEYGFMSDPMRYELLRSWPERILTSPEKLNEVLQNFDKGDDSSATFKALVDLLFHAAEMVLKIKGIETYVLDKPDQYILVYAEDWFTIDQHYRKGIKGLADLDWSSIPDFIDLDVLRKDINACYEKHIDQLNREWLACMNHFNFDYSQIGSPKQFDFYQAEIAPYDQKVVVVISDALRYEAGRELLKELYKDSKNTAESKYKLASIPSKTSLGMAQLLPHKSIAFHNGALSIDGISTEGSSNRESILKLFDTEAITVSYQDVVSNTKEENRALFRANLVYLYHDHIDSIGDQRKSEDRTFDAVESTIKELAILIKKLHGGNGVSRVLVTADHGFLYTDKSIEEKDKEEAFSNDTIQSHNRYEITTKDINPERGYCIPLKNVSHLDTDAYVSITKAVNRIKRQGTGHQFVHGGGSLQELIVPVIESTRKREDVVRKVKPLLVNQSRLKVVSNTCRVSILQEKPLSRHEKSTEIKIGLYKGLDQVSNVETILLDSVSENATGRTNEVMLNLDSSAFSETTLKLKIFDKDDMLNPLIEETIHNSSLISTDF